MKLALVNVKGGVGKTTTAVNLATVFARSGLKVLAVDLDPQGSATTSFGLSREEAAYRRVRIDRVRHKAEAHGRDLDLTPTEFRLLECLLRQPGRAFTRPQLMDVAIGEGAVVLERTIENAYATSPDLIAKVRAAFSGK